LRAGSLSGGRVQDRLAVLQEVLAAGQEFGRELAAGDQARATVAVRLDQLLPEALLRPRRRKEHLDQLDPPRRALAPALRDPRADLAEGRIDPDAAAPGARQAGEPRVKTDRRLDRRALFPDPVAVFSIEPIALRVFDRRRGVQREAA